MSIYCGLLAFLANFHEFFRGINIHFLSSFSDDDGGDDYKKDVSIKKKAYLGYIFLDLEISLRSASKLKPLPFLPTTTIQSPVGLTKVKIKSVLDIKNSQNTTYHIIFDLDAHCCSPTHKSVFPKSFYNFNF